MSTLIKILGVILGVFIIISALLMVDYGNDGVGLILIIGGVFQCCFSWLIADTYNMVKEIKENNLSYIEELVVYTKNQIKEIKGKIEDEEENSEE